MEDDLKEMQQVWQRVRTRGLDQKFYTALRQSISDSMNSAATPDDAYKILLQYQMVDQLQSVINQVLNLDEGNT